MLQPGLILQGAGGTVDQVFAAFGNRSGSADFASEKTFEAAIKSSIKWS